MVPALRDRADALVARRETAMSVVMKILTMNVRTPDGELDMVPLQDDLWLKSYDVDAHGGQGEITCTGKQKKALRFASHAHAMRAWRMQSTVKPLRADGKPNRPLSGFTV